jgi:hypothetical protein
MIDSGSGNAVAELSPPPVPVKWRAWKILLPKHDMQLEIIAQDQGAEWGEWLAVECLTDLGKPRTAVHVAELCVVGENPSSG